MKELYSFFSQASHPNRSLVPHRKLGEGDEFVLGMIGKPELFLVLDYCAKAFEGGERPARDAQTRAPLRQGKSRKPTLTILTIGHSTTSTPLPTTIPPSSHTSIRLPEVLSDGVLTGRGVLSQC
jgi:hypothetical protein